MTLPHQIRTCFTALLHIILLFITLYAFGAIIYNGPASAASTTNITIAAIWLAITLFTYFKFKALRTRAIATTILLLAVYIPYALIQPSNNREWDTDFTQTAYSTQQSDQITIHNFRHFDYQPDGTPIPHWTTKTVHLSNLRGIDYIHDGFGGKIMAHPMLSFDFGSDGHVLLSIETRREKGEHFSPIGGAYKMYELIYIFGAESDLVRVRTNFRKEPVYLYHFNFSPERCKNLFLASLETLNDLKKQARFYHILSANCTTSYRNQADDEDKKALKDWRLLANGQLDKMLDEKGWFKTNNLPFDELRKKSLISQKAQSVENPINFSTEIRIGNPAYSSDNVKK